MSTAAIINASDIYDPEQTHVLLRLLAEYTGKLTTECDKRESTIQRRNIVKLIIGTFLVLLTIGVFGLEVVSLNSVAIKRNPSLILKYDLVTPFVVLAVGSWFVGSNIFSLYTNSKTPQRDVLQITFTANQLERLVRRISPIAEHAGVGLGEKLELDLRLADADTALEYAAQYMGKRGNSENAPVRAAVFK